MFQNLSERREATQPKLDQLRARLVGVPGWSWPMYYAATQYALAADHPELKAHYLAEAKSPSLTTAESATVDALLSELSIGKE